MGGGHPPAPGCSPMAVLGRAPSPSPALKSRRDCLTQVGRCWWLLCSLVGSALIFPGWRILSILLAASAELLRQPSRAVLSLQFCFQLPSPRQSKVQGLSLAAAAAPFSMLGMSQPRRKMNGAGRLRHGLPAIPQSRRQLQTAGPRSSLSLPSALPPPLLLSLCLCRLAGLGLSPVELVLSSV